MVAVILVLLVTSDNYEGGFSSDSSFDFPVVSMSEQDARGYHSR